MRGAISPPPGGAGPTRGYRGILEINSKVYRLSNIHKGTKERVYPMSNFLGTIWWSALVFVAGGVVLPPMWAWVSGYFPWNKTK